MKKLTKKQIRDRVEFWKDEAFEALHNTVKRVRYAFPELDEPNLAAMAAKHPETARAIRYCRRRVARYRRMMRKR